MIKYTLNIEGMHCPHCEARVNEAIAKAFGVSKVVSSHESGQTVFTSKENIDEARLEAVVSETGFQFKGAAKEEIKKGFLGIFKK